LVDIDQLTPFAVEESRTRSVLDVFPLANDDGPAKFLVVITNRSDEKSVPVEFPVLALNGGATPHSQELAHGPIAPGTVGVLFAQYTIPVQAKNGLSSGVKRT
jgi:hypothetical protein